METNVCLGFAELAKQLVDVFRFDDVVDSVEIEDAVATRELVELLNDVLDALRPEFHSGTIQAAERAVILNAPPATASSLNGQQNSLRLVVVFVTALLTRIEVLVKVRHRRLVHVGEVWRAPVENHAIIFTPH